MLVPLAVTYFPYADSVNHLARYRLLHDFWFSETPPQGIEVRLLPTAYILGDLLGVALVHILASELVLPTLAIICLVILTAGAYALASAAVPQQRNLAPVASLLGFNWYLLYGFINYLLGIGLALLFIAWWWRRRDKMRLRHMAFLGVAACLLFFVHLAAIVLLVLAICLEYAVSAVRRWHRERKASALLDRSLWPAVLVLAVLTSLSVGTAAALPPPDYQDPTAFRSLRSKLLHLATPFFSFSLLQAVVLGGSYAACALAFVLKTWRRWQLTSLTILPPALLLSYLICPVSFFGAYDIDVRFLLPAYLLVFFVPFEGLKAGWLQRLGLALCLSSIVHAGVTLAYARSIDARLKDFRKTLTEVPSGANVLPLVADRQRYGRVDPYRHFVLWRVVDRVGSGPGLFSGARAGKQLMHFRETRPLYYPHEQWGTTRFEPLDWTRIRSVYQYVIQAGDDPRVSSIVAQQGTRLLQRGEIILYELTTR